LLEVSISGFTEERKNIARRTIRAEALEGPGDLDRSIEEMQDGGVSFCIGFVSVSVAAEYIARREVTDRIVRCDEKNDEESVSPDLSSERLETECHGASRFCVGDRFRK
jgi:hypothetical protein